MEYKLIPDTISHDTVEALATLLALAQEGEITGISFVCTLKKARYITNVAGWCYRNPTHSRGMVAFLADQLAGIVHARDQLETR
jgi:hypothetical protein